ncbi:ATP-dependent RNA helicase HrpA [Gammaproteobacteria bacterium]
MTANSDQIPKNEELPVSARRADIITALCRHPVVIVAGETGSGKTTQLPKICLEAGRGTKGRIGCTQPRRIAATSVASRVAKELSGEVGGLVGYQVRFSEKISPETRIKFMTDGILLAETQTDRKLNAYDTLIIDEAHERSLNIDFLLGYLKRILPRRRGLKVIVSSATLDTERFSEYFHKAPVIRVEGRTYPVEVRYQAPEEESDLAEQVADAVEEVLALGRTGDILIFLPGEREIREVASALAKRPLDRVLVLPLYARLTQAEQSRVFQSSGLLQIILSTNVAETSLTIPGIRTVIDTGLARINRYSPRAQVTRLRIENISRASADQRKGRCGRVGPGVCVRLYAESDYLARPAYTDPEIKRTSLASVILRMKALGLGDPEDFPFLETPHPRSILEGYQTLQELQALDESRTLTDIGRNLSNLPIDPRLGRMILAASTEGALQEVLIIASGLSIQDPRERPLAHQQAADEKHKRFQDERSDFVGWLKLWAFYEKISLGSSALRRFCREHFLSYNRMREWSDLHNQLVEVASELKLLKISSPASYEALHRALLTGLLSRVGMLQSQIEKSEKQEESDQKKRSYLGARGLQFFIFPGSGLFKKSPRWIVASEIVETTKVYARFVAKIEPEWLEPLAQHLVRRSYYYPHWEKKPGQVIALEQVTLYGLPIVMQRKTAYGLIDPVISREIFIRSALVQGDYATQAPFFKHNHTLIEEIEELEHKSRRKDILADEQIIYSFYDEKVPEDVFDHRSFEKWRRETEKKDQKILFLDRSVLIQNESAIAHSLFPNFLIVEGVNLPLEYRFEPGALEDGVMLEVPLAFLSSLQEYHGDYLVPGLLLEKITFLLRNLPKSLRTNFIPVTEYARAAYETFIEVDQKVVLRVVLSQFLKKLTGVAVSAADFRIENLPNHLKMGFRIIEEKKILAEDRDLFALQSRFGRQSKTSFRELAKHYERECVSTWDFGSLPEWIDLPGKTMRGYPALAEEADKISLRLFETLEKAKTEHARGLRRLFSLQCASQVRSLERSLLISRNASLAYARFGNLIALKQDVVTAILIAAFPAETMEIRDSIAFQTCLVAARGNLVSTAEEVTQLVETILIEYGCVSGEIQATKSISRESHEDLRTQVDALVYSGFIVAIPLSRLRHYPRYLKAMRLRIERMKEQPLRDQERLAEIAPWWSRFLKSVECTSPSLEEFRWMLEEWRVSLFAQELKTAVPVSAKRIEKAWGVIPS